mmetsp:Transcript_8812/g.18856  ORF Transcript_8812/g.18856 Transcript_8812/m.18856 type:complete len:284 (-) Transcript_8812:727-1578(-)
MLSQAVLLLQQRVLQEDGLCLIRGSLGQCVLKQVTRSLQLGALVALHKLLEVGLPDVAHMGVLEHGHAALIHLERVLPVLVLLQVQCEVEDDLRGGYAQLHDALVHGPSTLQGAQALLQVRKQRPQLQVPVEPLLHRQRALLLHRHALGPLRLRCRPPHQLQGFLEVLVAQLHLHPLAPHLGQVVHVLVSHLARLVKDYARVGQVAVALIELGKCAPQRVRLANRLLNVHRLDGLGVREDLLGGLPLKQLDALVPLGHIVRVLPQHHTAQQLRAPRHQPLQAS